MKKLALLLFVLPLLSCANPSENGIPDIAYSSETSAVTKRIDHQKWDSLLQKHVTAKGNVDYLGFKKDLNRLQTYLDELSANVPQKSWSKNAVLAYWINAYNAFTVKLILDHYPVESIKDIKRPWDQEFIVLGGRNYSLGEIEHDILREMNAPRIHFAINCASFSCPDLAHQAYTEQNLEEQLDAAAKTFINDKNKNTITADYIEISKIFKWFSGDFEIQGTLIDFLNKYSKLKIDNDAKVQYKDYNWSLNE